MSDQTFTVRRAMLGDAHSIADAEARFIDCPWTAEQIKSEIIADNALFFVAEAESGEFVGYLSGDIAADECEISNIAVMPEYRRRGVGFALFDAMFDAARGAGVSSMFLLVRTDNAPAIALYKKIGFDAVGIRPCYYKGKDAVIMRRNL